MPRDLVKSLSHFHPGSDCYYLTRHGIEIPTTQTKPYQAPVSPVSCRKALCNSLGTWPFNILEHIEPMSLSPRPICLLEDMGFMSKA